MGTIVSPVNGSSFYKGSVIPVVYRSDTIDFGCGSLSHICTINYLLDTVAVASNVNISQTGSAPQTQTAQNVTLPTTGATATVDVEGWGVGGQLNDTATATYNLVDDPTAACNPATLVTQTTATLNGTITGTLIAGGSARFVYGSPTPNTNAATSHVAGAVNAALTGLTPNTVYNYRLEVLDAAGNVVATSPQCTFTTLAAVATPTATCSAGTGATQTTATLNGTLANVPAGGSARFRYGTVAGGPYGTNAAATPYANGAVTANVTGLTANTQYYYILEILDNTATVVATSAECTVTTLAVVPPAPAPASCTIPDGVSKCPPIQVYSIGGTEYAALQVCDNNGALLAVYQLCAGVISGAPTYYTLTGASYTPVGTLHDCSAGSDFEQLIFCDTDTDPPTPFISRVRWDENGDLVPEATGTFALDGVTPYTPVGIVSVCGGDVLEVLPICFTVNATPTVKHQAYKVVKVTDAVVSTLYYYESNTGTIHLPADVTEEECTTIRIIKTGFKAIGASESYSLDDALTDSGGAKVLSFTYKQMTGTGSATGDFGTIPLDTFEVWTASVLDTATEQLSLTTSFSSNVASNGRLLFTYL